MADSKHTPTKKPSRLEAALLKTAKEMHRISEAPECPSDARVAHGVLGNFAMTLAVMLNSYKP